MSVTPDRLQVPPAVVSTGSVAARRRGAPVPPHRAARPLPRRGRARRRLRRLSGALPITAYAVGRYAPAGRCGSSPRSSARWPSPALDRWPSSRTSLGGLASTAFAVLLPGAIGAYVRTRAELLEALTERAERAEAERELLAREAVADRAHPHRPRDARRRRPPGEPHGAAGRRDRDGRRRPRRVEQLAWQVQTAGRQALDELRQAVGVLRDGEDDGAPLAPQPGLDDLAAAGQGVPGGGDDRRAAPARRTAEPVDRVVGRAAYRIVQEALTNAGKHAPGAAGPRGGRAAGRRSSSSGSSTAPAGEPRRASRRRLRSGGAG